MNIKEFADNELKILIKTNLSDDEEAKKVQEELNKNLLQVLDVLYDQHHTNFSMYCLMRLLVPLVRGIPLTELTGTDDEFEKISEYEASNIRCPKIHRYIDEKTGEVTYKDTVAKIFCEPDSKEWFSAKESIEEVDFPLSPEKLIPRCIQLKYKTDDVPLQEQLLKGDFIEVREGVKENGL